MVHIPLAEIYEQLKYWLPVTTVLGLLFKAYTKARNSMSIWAGALIDNHMTHIQAATEKASDAVVQLANYHRDMLDSQHSMVSTLHDMKTELHEYAKDSLDVQSNIVTNLEVVKAKLDASLIAKIQLTTREKEVDVVTGEK